MFYYYGTVLSDHITKKPNGGIICTDVPIARTGTQEYLARELHLDGDPERVITVTREPAEVFSAAAMASFEGVCICDSHPPEDVTAENFSQYSKGHVQNIRRSGDYLVGDLHIDDAVLADQVLNKAKRQISCGYTCQYVPLGNGYTQREIRGNHVAIVLRGRAGSSVSIHDNSPKGRKEGKIHMSKFTEAILSAFGMAIKETNDQEEIKSLVTTTATALDAGPTPAAALEEKPAAKEEPTADLMVEQAPKGDDLGSKLDRLIEMVGALKREENPGEKKQADGLEELVEQLEGKKEDPEKAVTIPADEMDACASSNGRDAALAIVKAMQPVVASIEDKAVRAQVTDALLAAFKGPDVLGAIDSAAQASARKAADAAGRTSYEQRCADSEAAYAARNPHKHTDKEV